MSEQTKLDLNKPVQTRDGRPVRVLCTDAKGSGPLVGLIDNGQREIEFSWPLSGQCVVGTPSATDLINVPPRKVKMEGWVNIIECAGFKDAIEGRVVRNAAIWPTEEIARLEAETMGDVIATIRIDTARRIIGFIGENADINHWHGKEAARDLIEGALKTAREEGIAALKARVAELEGVIGFVESWVCNPVGAYSVAALDGLFGMTRDRIAALKQEQPE